MHELPLLVNIAVALAYALAGGLVARRLGLPTIVGYLAAGVALGPFTAGFRGDERAIHQLAEFGVILLMFGVGLHFSFRDLWQVRRIAIPGAVIQMALVASLGALVALYWGASTAGAWVYGIAISVASTVVLMRVLMDSGWLDTPTGKIAIGWLIVEDLLMVAVLVLLPVVASPGGTASWTAPLIAVGKAVLFVALMMFAGDRVVPALLGRVVHLRSRELFVLVALTVAVGTALASSAYFGVSLALGAFVAGIVVGKSPFSHQVGADLLPFREAFAVIFFVSIGMLVDPRLVAIHWQRVLVTTLLIVAGKGLLSGLIARLLGCPAHTSLVLAAGRSQIGEFSFIVGQTGLALGSINDQQYSLILASAMLSILINPLMVRLVEPVEHALRRRPRLWAILDGPPLTVAPPPGALTDHVVIVGCGRVGRHIAETLGRLKIQRLVVEADPTRLDKLSELGVPVLYGDASSSDILEHAELARARALVITLPDDAAALTVVATAKKLAPKVHILARASTWDGARRLKADGAHHVVRPELEGGVEIVRRTLLELDLPVREVQRYTELIRRDELDESARPSPEQARVLHDLVTEARQLEIVWLEVTETNPVAGRTLAEARLRTNTGVSVVAIGRPDALVPNPDSAEVLRPGDRIAVIGTPAQVSEAERLFGSLAS